MSLRLDALCCPHCRKPLKPDRDMVLCTSCARSYPAPHGIPLLVRDSLEHERQMASARETNPLWYEQAQAAEAESPWRHHLRKRRRYVQRVLSRELAARGTDRAARLLDLGCGDGTNLPWLASFAEELYGSDYNLLRLNRASQRMPDASVFLGDVLDYPADDGAFDVIFFNHVIEHIPDDIAALAEVRRILRPGGLLVLGAPNEGAFWWQWAYHRSPETLATTDHLHFYTAATLAKRMEGAGLTVFETRHLGWGPPDWRLDGRLRRHKFLDDLFEIVGRTLLPTQASSLYLLATR